MGVVMTSESTTDVDQQLLARADLEMLKGGADS